MGVLTRLSALEEQHHMVHFFSNEEWLAELPAVYSFEHILMRRQFYEGLSEPLRTELHREVGDFLERLLNQADAPGKLALEIARHHDYANKPLSAAHHYYLAAQFSFYDGAFKETVELCKRALKQVRTLTEGVAEHDRLRAEVIHLLLTASWTGWRGKPELKDDELSLAELGEEGEAAALRTNDQALLANSKYLKGKILLATHSLESAVEAMKEALDAARKAGDPLLEFAIMPDLGMQLNGLGMQANGADQAPGLKLQYQAYELYKDKLVYRTDLHKSALQRIAVTLISLPRSIDLPA